VIDDHFGACSFPDRLTLAFPSLDAFGKPLAAPRVVCVPIPVLHRMKRKALSVGFRPDILGDPALFPVRRSERNRRGYLLIPFLVIVSREGFFREKEQKSHIYFYFLYFN
jgi:hypothetical protein